MHGQIAQLGGAQEQWSEASFHALSHSVGAGGLRYRMNDKITQSMISDLKNLAAVSNATAMYHSGVRCMLVHTTGVTRTPK